MQTLIFSFEVSIFFSFLTACKSLCAELVLSVLLEKRIRIVYNLFVQQNTLCRFRQAFVVLICPAPSISQVHDAGCFYFNIRFRVLTYEYSLAQIILHTKKTAFLLTVCIHSDLHILLRRNPAYSSLKTFFFIRYQLKSAALQSCIPL